MSPTILQVVCGIALAAILAALWPTLAAAEDDAAFAQRIIQERNCRNCHSIAGEGAPGPGPDLTTVGARRDSAWLHRWLRDPGAIKPGTLMPKFKWTEPELDAVIAYLLSLSGDDAAGGDSAEAAAPPQGFPYWWAAVAVGTLVVIAVTRWLSLRRPSGGADSS